MHEKDIFVIGSTSRAISQNTVARLLKPLEVGIRIRRLKGQMMKPRSALFKKTGDGRVFMQRFKQFYLCPTGIEEMGTHTFRGNFFRFVGRSTEKNPEMGQAGLYIVYGNADMLKNHG